MGYLFLYWIIGVAALFIITYKDGGRVVLRDIIVGIFVAFIWPVFLPIRQWGEIVIWKGRR